MFKPFYYTLNQEPSFSAQRSSGDCSHFGTQKNSKAFSSYKTGILYPLNNTFPFSLPCHYFTYSLFF